MAHPDLGSSAAVRRRTTSATVTPRAKCAMDEPVVVRDAVPNAVGNNRDVSRVTRSATAQRAQRPPTRKRDTLRYLRAGAIWTALPIRDQRLLLWLLQADGVTAHPTKPSPSVWTQPSEPTARTAQRFVFTRPATSRRPSLRPPAIRAYKQPPRPFEIQSSGSTEPRAVQFVSGSAQVRTPTCPATSTRIARPGADQRGHVVSTPGDRQTAVVDPVPGRKRRDREFGASPTCSGVHHAIRPASLAGPEP